ncbi:electron transport complex subunit RsxG [Pseudoteredinibacter isoporae]|uniref:Ion-translocating oxidoreductase complex subunit G n=1 Tax=Pseudoteredinibacter isoporae TaxID=570281 RepID=A0A7X0JVI9_9GAMM|nr:electron transport complex subunit RsxG [Pseudoteredinibacter isoporae]MBB6522081.1 electron transport complex protein RnfG [Pseudoteredinibacter isoporae]NHO87616.1 electron transport complex subunit RsxG [Pseudoteredinibacter isoporae]NIB24053.1 electron transport complex subunit RsxG [Pseudoteredinibacter isoporae]
MTLGNSIGRNAIILGAFALLTAAVLAGTQLLTKDRIAAEQRKAAEQALLEIISSLPEKHDNDMLAESLDIPKSLQESLSWRDAEKVYIAKKGEQVLAYLVPAIAPDGYSGDIKILIGITPNGLVTGVRVLAHKETPGLGDKVELKKSDWILSFTGRSLTPENESTWAVKKDGGDFDQFTGATITPRAVVNQVKASVQAFSQWLKTKDADDQREHSIAKVESSHE